MLNLITLTGPSCSGKSEIMQVIENRRSDCKILPKYTTRKARANDDEPNRAELIDIYNKTRGGSTMVLLSRF